MPAPWASVPIGKFRTGKGQSIGGGSPSHSLTFDMCLADFDSSRKIKVNLTHKTNGTLQKAPETPVPLVRVDQAKRRETMLSKSLGPKLRFPTSKAAEKSADTPRFSETSKETNSTLATHTDEKTQPRVPNRSFKITRNSSFSDHPNDNLNTFVESTEFDFTFSGSLRPVKGGSFKKCRQSNSEDKHVQRSKEFVPIPQIRSAETSLQYIGSTISALGGSIVLPLIKIQNSKAVQRQEDRSPCAKKREEKLDNKHGNIPDSTKHLSPQSLKIGGEKLTNYFSIDSQKDISTQPANGQRLKLFFKKK